MRRGSVAHGGGLDWIPHTQVRPRATRAAGAIKLRASGQQRARFAPGHNEHIPPRLGGVTSGGDTAAR
jgi:hypothetical protein